MQKWKENKFHPNNLQLDTILDEIKCLNRLEIFLICKMPFFKGQSPTLLGPVVNMPVDVNKAFNDNTYLAKLKKKLSFKGHVFFELNNSEKVRRALLK